MLLVRGLDVNSIPFITSMSHIEKPTVAFVSCRRSVFNSQSFSHWLTHRRSLHFLFVSSTLIPHLGMICLEKHPVVRSSISSHSYLQVCRRRWINFSGSSSVSEHRVLVCRLAIASSMSSSQSLVCLQIPRQGAQHGGVFRYPASCIDAFI